MKVCDRFILNPSIIVPMPQILRYLNHAHRYAVSRFVTGKPVILSHALHMQCNSKCKICNIWKQPNKHNEMTTHEIKSMLRDARKSGFVSYVALGGEPLMRPDTVEILNYAYSLGFYTTIITNGWFLPEKAEELAKAAKLTWVSLDYDTPYHDEMRGCPGVFERAINGIKTMIHHGGRVRINCVISNMNLDAPCKMLELGQDLGVQVAFDPMEIFPGNEQYALTEIQQRTVFSEIIQLKNDGYPVLNAYEFLDHLVNPLEYECAQSRVFLKVEADGSIYPFWCPGNGEPLGNLCTQKMNDILDSNLYREFAEASKSCNKCTNSSTVEASIFYSTRGLLQNLPKRANKYLKFALDYGFR